MSAPSLSANSRTTVCRSKPRTVSSAATNTPVRSRPGQAVHQQRRVTLDDPRHRGEEPLAGLLVTRVVGAVAVGERQVLGGAVKPRERVRRPMEVEDRPRRPDLRRIRHPGQRAAAQQSSFGKAGRPERSERPTDVTEVHGVRKGCGHGSHSGLFGAVASAEWSRGPKTGGLSARKPVDSHRGSPRALRDSSNPSPTRYRGAMSKQSQAPLTWQRSLGILVLAAIAYGGQQLGCIAADDGPAPAATTPTTSSTAEAEPNDATRQREGRRATRVARRRHADQERVPRRHVGVHDHRRRHRRPRPP